MDVPEITPTDGPSFTAPDLNRLSCIQILAEVDVPHNFSERATELTLVATVNHSSQMNV